jgi:chemotaxis protein histidine kinase CheA
MMLKKKKKYDEDEDLKEEGFEEETLDFKEFEEYEKELDKKKESAGEIEKNFIFHIENGCPICGSDVKGNDHYRYFCESCNLLFDKKDILTKEFGKTLAEGEKPGPVRKTRLTDEEKADLAKKRKELKERVFKAFSEAEKKELVREAEERKEEEAEPEEEEPEQEEPESPEEVVEETPEEEPAEETEPSPLPEKEEYNLEDESKIIASKESTKMHTGQCHFVKKIHPHNRIYLGSVTEGEEKGYQMCVCLRRLKAKAR